jgi:hypothetical protein
MLYYHVRYRIHSHADAPDVREEWIETSTYTTNQQVQDMLVAKHSPNISFIRCIQISPEDYRLQRNLPHINVLNQAEIDATNLAIWIHDENARMKQKLREDDLTFHDRFGSADRPTPLL